MKAETPVRMAIIPSAMFTALRKGNPTALLVGM